MLHRLPLLLSFLLLTFRSLAQVYEPGWLVRSNGDTLRGEIENSFWQEPPTFIHYRPAPGSAASLFRPGQLRAVGLTNGRYFRGEVLPFDHAAETNLDRLHRGFSQDIRLDTLLAEVLVEGSLSLLRVYRPTATHYFLLQAGQPVLELSERQYLRQTTTDGAWVITDANSYQGQLSNYFHDCPAAFAATQHAAFTAEDLAALVGLYNESCGPTHQPGRSWLTMLKPRRRTAFQGGLQAGLRYNHIRRNQARPEQASACTDCAIRPLAGLYAEVLLPGRRAAVYGELSASPFQSKNTITTGHTITTTPFPGGVTTTYIPIYYDYNYRGWLGTMYIGVRYFFPLPHEQQLTLSLLYEKNFVGFTTTTRTAGPSAPLTSDDFHFAKQTLLPGLGLGWRYQHLSLSIDGRFYSADLPDGTFSSHFYSSAFGLRFSTAYRLGRNPDRIRARPSLPNGR